MTVTKMDNDYVVIDVETTGTNPAVNSLVSLALVPLDDNKACFTVHVRPDDPNWTDVARKYFKGFENEWNRESVTPIEACRRLEQYLESNFSSKITLIGHNVGFDLSFLRRLYAEAGLSEITGISHRSIDTHSVLFALWMLDLTDKHLQSSDEAFRYFNVVVPKNMRHTALGDALGTKELYRKIISALKLVKSV